MGGAINRVGSADTAYGERTAQWMSSFDGNWEDPNDNAANIAWVRDAFDQVAAVRQGQYLHQLHRPGRRDRRRVGPERLRRQHRATPGDQEAVRPRQLLPHQPEHPSGVARNTGRDSRTDISLPRAGMLRRSVPHVFVSWTSATGRAISRSPVVSVGHVRPGRRGGCDPRASIASATSGWYPWNPNAMRVRSRILVFVDSIRPCERPVSSAASIAARCVAILRWRWTNAGIRERRAQIVHRSSASLPSSPLTANTYRSPSLRR